MNRWLGWVVAVIGTALAAGLRWGLGHLIGPAWTPFITFYPVVMVSALLGGVGPGMLASALSAVLVDLFFLEPVGTLGPTRPADQLGLALFCGINIATSLVCGAFRAARARAVVEARRAALSEKRLRATFQQAAVGILGVDTQDRITAANDRASELLGYTEEQFLAMSVHDVTYPEDRPLSDQLNRELHEGRRRRLEYEKRYLRSDGSPLWVHVTVSPVRDAQGRDLGSFGTFEDITERKRAQLDLQTAKERIETILASITDSFFALDRELRFTYVNAEAQRVLRKTPAELLGGYLADLFPHAEAFLAQYHRVLSTEKPAHFEEFYAPLQIWFEVHAYPSPEGLAVFFRDVTERKQAEEAIRASEERYRILFNTIDQGFCIAEVLFENGEAVDYRYLQVNPAFEKHTGIVAAQGRTAREINPDLERHWFELLGKVVSTGEPAHYEQPAAPLHRWFAGYAFGLGPRQNHHVGILFSDITARKRAQEALRASETGLRLAVETAQLGTYERDLQTNEVSMNDTCQALLGASTRPFPPDIANRSVFPDDRERVQAALAKAFDPALREMCAAEFRILRPDGTIRWVAGRGRVIFDDSVGPPRATRFMGVLNDITERKLAEARLGRDLEAITRLHQLGALFLRKGNLQSVLEEIVETAIAISEADFGNIQLLDQGSGLHIAAHRGFPQWYLDYWNEVTAGHGSCGTALAQGQRTIVPDVEQSPIFVGTVALEMQRRAGVRAVQSTPILSPSGKPLGMFSTHFRTPHTPDEHALKLLDLLARQASDIIERAQSEVALQRRNQHLAILHKAAADLLLGRSPADLLLGLHNQIARDFGVDVFTLYEAAGDPQRLQLQAWAGVSEEEHRKLKTMRYGRAICAKPAEALYPIIASHIQTREAPNRRFVRKLGFRSYLYFPLLRNGHLGGTLAFASRQREEYEPGDLEFFETIARTVTEALERHRLESELQRYATRLEHTVQERTARLRETVAELEGFSYSLVHDMRAPLRAMLAYAGILEMEAGSRLQPEESDLLRKLSIAAQRMDHLITDSLNYSRILRQDLPLGPVNLGSLLRGMLETYPNLHPPQASVSIEFGDLVVQGNEAALTQIFSNILGNAVKFVAPGVYPRARVWAETSPLPRGHGQGDGSADVPSSNSRGSAGSVRVFVQDNGIGIPRSAHDKIFGMFQRMHSVDEYPGTGIGLALVKKSLERTGGFITLESEPGKGSCFCLHLPLPRQQSEQALAE